jgi:hypothetical protein
MLLNQISAINCWDSFAKLLKEKWQLTWDSAGFTLWKGKGSSKAKLVPTQLNCIDRNGADVWRSDCTKANVIR